MWKRKNNKKIKKMKDDNYRIIKISADALFEYIYEHFIDEQEKNIDVDIRNVKNTYTVDWENKSFIFCAYNSKDKDGNYVSFPVDIEKLVKKLPDTTDTMYDDNRYKDYSEKELLKILEEEV